MKVFSCIETRRPCLVLSYSETMPFLARTNVVELADWLRDHKSGHALAYDYDLRLKHKFSTTDQSQAFVFPDMHTLILFRLAF
jgi:hypothetical protein